MNRFSISVRTLAISAVALVGFAAVVVATVWADWQQAENRSAERSEQQKMTLVQAVSKDFLEARRSEKDFLLRHDLAYVDKHDRISERLIDRLSDLNASLQGDDRILGA